MTQLRQEIHSFRKKQFLNKFLQEPLLSQDL